MGLEENLNCQRPELQTEFQTSLQLYDQIVKHTDKGREINWDRFIGLELQMKTREILYSLWEKIFNHISSSAILIIKVMDDDREFWAIGRNGQVIEEFQPNLRGRRYCFSRSKYAQGYLEAKKKIDSSYEGCEVIKLAP